MNLAESFRENRRVSTPIVLVQSPDYRAVQKLFSTIKRVEADQEPPCVEWDLARGHRPYNDKKPADKKASQKLGEPDDTASAPVVCLNRALGLPEYTILFMVFPTNEVLNDPVVAQAIANVRDEFKKDTRTLVILGRSLTAPPLVAEDIPVLREELPTEPEIREIISSVYNSANQTRKQAGKGLLEQDEKNIQQAASLCLGLTRFITEDGVSRKLRQKNIDVEGLRELQRTMVETSTDRALRFETETWKFDEIGGLQAFKDMMNDLFSGPQPPRLIVRIDEIDKEITAASTGRVADNTGASQYQLKAILNAMEEYRIMGCLLAGGPGTGKSLATICTGNEFGCTTLVLDLGATKASLLGESERRVRTVFDIIRAIGGNKGDVIFMGTANRLETLPPELQRRFTTLGKWFFDAPSQKELEVILKIQAKKFQIDLSKQKKPDMDGWVGSDVRNCCQLAWRTGTTLEKAATRITLAGRASAADVEKLRQLAETEGFLCANRPGAYTRPTKGSGGERRVSV